MNADDADDVPWGELHVDEIEELLEELGTELSPKELHQLALFVKQLGSLEAAVEALEELERKAA